MLESMWSSMSSSMQLAQECLEKNEDEEAAAASASTSTMEGLEKFAQTIDNSKTRRSNRCLRDSYHSSMFSSFKSHQGEVYQHGSEARVPSKRFRRRCRVNHENEKVKKFVFVR